MRTAPTLAFTYGHEKLKDRVEPLAASVGSRSCCRWMSPSTRRSMPCSARSVSDWGSLDILVHAVAFAPREALAGDFVSSTSREAFAIAHDVSSYSLTALTRAAAPADGRPGRRSADAELPGRSALRARLQRHGPGQGEPGSQCALPGGGSRARRASGSMAFRPARSRPWRRPASPGCARCWAMWRQTCAAAPQRHAGGRGQCRDLPLLGHGQRRDRRDPLRRRRLQYGGDELSERRAIRR